MTVTELIGQLEQCPPDMEVCVQSENGMAQRAAVVEVQVAWSQVVIGS